ncbi:MAG: nicotianamine synthase family protein [Spirochaetota bacterium]|nr:nicotianamine synthase family protein [Spirochaetota bacterium]
MRPKNANEIMEYLEEIYDRIKDFTNEEILHAPKELINEPFLMLDKIAAIDIEDKEIDTLLRNESFGPLLQSISNLRRRYGLRLEIEQALEVLNSSDPWKTLEKFVFYANYKMLANMEYTGAELNTESKVIFIGSGPLPLSLISLSKHHGIIGMGIEQDSDRVDLSQKVIEHLELSSKIQIVHGNHLLLPLEESYELIMIAASAEPKDDIFAYMAKALPEGTKVTYRVFEKGLRRILDLQKNFIPPPEFKEYRRIHPTPPVNNTAIFLTKT